MDLHALLATYEFQRSYLSLLVDDIAEPEMAKQPGKVANHPAWQLGHLATSTDQWIGICGGTKKIDENWSRHFAFGSTPTADRSAYPSKTNLIEMVDDRRAALIERCRIMTDAEWALPHPVKPLQQSLATLWQAMHFFMLTHESTHLGQLASWRHAQGMPMALAKIAG